VQDFLGSMNAVLFLKLFFFAPVSHCYPRDAMLAQYLPSRCVRLSVHRKSVFY